VRDDRAAVVLPALAGVVPHQLGRFLEKGVGPMTALVIGRARTRSRP
jgi:hypothetical protein